MSMESLQDLFVDELRDLYNAESQLIKALPKMAKAASSKELKMAFEEHLEQTREQVERLDKIFEQLGTKRKSRKCRGMEGVLEEGKEIIEEEASPAVKDAALIAAAQKAEHYEIASYGTVRTYAQMLGNTEAARLLQQTLDEEGQTDRKLTSLAEGLINPQAQESEEQ